MSQDAENNTNNDTPCQAHNEAADVQMSLDDRGATDIRVGVENGQVVLQLPKAVSAIGFSPRLALEVGVSLMKHARRAGLKEALVWRVGDHRPHCVDDL